MSDILLTAALLGLVQCIAMFGACLFLRHVLNAKQAEVEERLEKMRHEWVDPGPNNTPSKFAFLLDTAGAVVGSAAARSIMGSLNAGKSQEARQANTANEVLGAQANPLLGLLSQSKRGKGAAVARLMETLGPMLGGGGGNHKDVSGGTPQFPL